MDEPTLEQSLAQLLAKVPPPIQQYVLNELSDEVQALMGKYQLHVDQGGVLQTELLLMLLGQEAPADFMKALRAAGIGEGTVQSLMVDINEQVFKPLRQKEISESVAPVAAPIQKPEPTPAPQDPERGVRTMEADIQAARAVAPPAYQPPQYQPGAQTQTYWVPVSITAVPQPYMTTQAPPQYQQPSPAPAPAPIETPQVEEPVPVPPPSIPAPPERTWEPPPPPNLPTAEPANTPLKKEYGADPYREPI